jgi:hypothetical protein
MLGSMILLPGSGLPENHLPAALVVRSVTSAVDLYWLPLGAGGHSVRFNGRVFEFVASRLGHRPVCGLYHSALTVQLPGGRFVIEMTPIRTIDDPRRVAAATGAVGSQWAGHLRVFRYEACCWSEGAIPDADEAVDSPQRLTDDPERAHRVLELVSDLPAPVWGRDELGTGEMWNSNSVTAWLIARSGLDAESIHPPPGGRAPGWDAGCIVARREPVQDLGAAALVR